VSLLQVAKAERELSTDYADYTDSKIESNLQFVRVMIAGAGGQGSYYITSPKLIWWLWVESNHQPFAYETKALPFELHSHF
jgi:hypothetical protein